MMRRNDGDPRFVRRFGQATIRLKFFRLNPPAVTQTCDAMRSAKAMATTLTGTKRVVGWITDPIPPRSERQPDCQAESGCRLRDPRCRMTCAAISSRRDTPSTMVPIALISGVTPRRIEEKT